MTSTEPAGRYLNGVWYGAHTNYTVNCASNDGEGCTGWIAPTLGPRPCMDPRHDTNRMTHEQARELTEQRIAAREAADRRAREAADRDTDEDVAA